MTSGLCETCDLCYTGDETEMLDAHCRHCGQPLVMVSREEARAYARGLERPDGRSTRMSEPSSTPTRRLGR
jgi:hypothetical protein